MGIHSKIVTLHAILKQKQLKPLLYFILQEESATLL
jgi:hypothetical protein